MPERVFFDWSSPLLPALADHSLPESGHGPLDLGHTLFLVPTRQSGRRFREVLTRAWRERGGTALLSLTVLPPSALLQPNPDTPVAGTLDILMAWRTTLRSVSPENLPSLFGGTQPDLSDEQRLDLGQQIQRLRDELLDAGVDIREASTRPALASEQARWQDLADLEETYRQELTRKGLVDPVDAKRSQLRNYTLPEGCERLVLAGVPDPSPIVRKQLEQMDAMGVSIEVWIHAPTAEADAFDAWGKPSHLWRHRHLGENRLNPADLELHADPDTLAARVSEWLADAPDTPDLALGLLVEDIAAPLEDTLNRQNQHLYVPNPVPLADTPLVRELKTLQDHRHLDNPLTLRALWRQPALMKACGADDLETVLQHWDRYAAEHVPENTAAVTDTLEDPVLLPVWEKMRKAMEARSPAQTLALLRDMTAEESLDSAQPEDRYRRRQYQALADLLQDAARRESQGQSLPPSLWMRALQTVSIDPLRIEDALTAEGWLELPYHPAESLLLLGMQEGAAPPALSRDPLLPNTLRQELGLSSDRDWIIRDAYLFHTLLCSRKPGHVRILTLKRDAAGNPCLPSRYLLACEQSALQQRASLLFAPPAAPPLQPPPAPGITLQAANLSERTPKALSVSAVGQYLRCPTRFYFRFILGLDALDDTALQPDAAAFGSLLHRVLEQTVRHNPGTPSEWTDQCDTLLQAELCRHYGRDQGLPLRVLARSALARLRAVAPLHFTLREQGWTLHDTECRLERSLNDMPIHGIIDRLEHHPELGWLLLDYKTSDSPTSPDKAHLGTPREGREVFHLQVGKKTRQWKDLQLPLYRWLAEAHPPIKESGQPVRVAYINLPRAVSQTELVDWPQEQALQADALQALQQVIDHIRNRVWTPASPGSDWDPFAPLLQDGADWVTSATSAPA